MMYSAFIFTGREIEFCAEGPDDERFLPHGFR
jgi:hypothetical protein